LIPNDAWAALGLSEDNIPGQLQIMELASKLKIPPAIIAGRIRYETNNFRKSQPYWDKAKFANIFLIIKVNYNYRNNASKVSIGKNILVFPSMIHNTWKSYRV
jgi:hypothetical protein